jgi:hypothetical protein
LDAEPEILTLLAAAPIWETAGAELQKQFDTIKFEEFLYP